MKQRWFLAFAFIFSFYFLLATSTPADAAQPRRFRRAMPSEAQKPAQFEKKPLIEVDPYDVVIPEEAGRIKEVHKAENPKGVVVHIQDAHCNYEAQANIAKIVEHLIKNYQVSLAAVEGSTGLIDTTPFRTMASKDSKSEIADYYMKKGRVTGPEYLSITGPYNFTLWGIEDEDKYLNNYDAFLKTIKFQEEMKKYCAELKLVIDTLKARIYPAELKEFDNRLTSFTDKFESFTEYADLLEQKSREKKLNMRDYKNFVLQMKAKFLEKKINFDKVDKERAKLVDELGKTLDKETLSQLVVKSLSYRLAKISSNDYYDYLTQVVEKAKFDLKEYPNLEKYIEYSKAFHSIDTFDLLLEAEKIEEAIKETMFTEKDQKELDRLAKHLRMLTQMYDLSLSKEDVRYYNEHKKEFALKNFTAFIDKHAPKHKLYFTIEPGPKIKAADKYVPAMQAFSKGVEAVDTNRTVTEDFYKYAMIRDEVLVKNTVKKMEEANQKSCFMVTGGFHTHGVTHQLKEQGYSYLVISPRITKDDPTNPYIEVMMGQQNSFQNMLSGFETGQVPKE